MLGSLFFFLYPSSPTFDPLGCPAMSPCYYSVCYVVYNELCNGVVALAISKFYMIFSLVYEILSWQLYYFSILLLAR